MSLHKRCFFSGTPSRMFLVDSLGAALSSCLLVGIVVPLEPLFGIPAPIAYILAAIAGSYALYGICCYLTRPVNWRRYLRIQVGANLFYACLTAALILYYYHRITVWCLLYFSLELVVISGLILLERSLLICAIKGESH